MVETRVGRRHTERELPLTVSGAGVAIDALDGHDTTVTVFERDGYSLYVGGGPDRFSVTYMTPAGNGYTLVLNPDAEETEEITLGGQRINFPVRDLVCREAADKAAGEFVQTGSVKLTPEWRLDTAHTS